MVLILYLLLCAANILFDQIGFREGVLFTKPLLMPVLATWFLQQNRQGKVPAFRNLVIGALLFSTAGDTLLMFAGGAGGALYFLLGLSAFLLAHLCYIGAFFSIIKGKTGFLKTNPLYILPFLLYLGILLFVLYPGIPGGMKVPVVLYGCVITGMALSVMHLRGRVPAGAWTSLMSGAVLFVLSDSLIALNKFGYPLGGAAVLIMITYVIGQYLLVRGAKLCITAV